MTEPPEPSATPSTLERLVEELNSEVKRITAINIEENRPHTMPTLLVWQFLSRLAALRPSEGPPQEPTREWLQKRCAWYQQELERITAALPAGPETGDRERLRELAFIGAVAVHREVWRYSHNAINIDGHTDRDFNACPHPDCVLVRQAAPAASEGQK